LEAFALLARPDSNLLIVGNGPLRGELEAKAKGLGIGARTLFVKAMGQQDLPLYLNCMEVLVLPSLTTPKWKEQFGRVIIEAQACEVPVIGSDSGAIPEVIEKAGFIFPEANAVVLKEDLEKLASSPGLRTDLARKGRQRVLENYTNQIIADQTYEIYKGLFEKV
jgi:glycosyltransferase involved in cell wall biosynthesis